MKKISVLFLVLSLIIGSSVLSTAGEVEIVPFEVGPCPDHGIHKMYNTGSWAEVHYEPTGEMIAGAYGEYICICGEVVVTQGTPHLDNPIGNYWTGNYLTKIHDWGTTTSYETNKYSPFYTSKSWIDGYRFYD